MASIFAHTANQPATTFAALKRERRVAGLFLCSGIVPDADRHSIEPIEMNHAPRATARRARHWHALGRPDFRSAPRAAHLHDLAQLRAGGDDGPGSAPCAAGWAARPGAARLRQNTPAQFHGRPELVQQLADELRQLLARQTGA